MGRGGPVSGSSAGEGVAAHLGQGPLGAVEEAGQRQRARRPTRAKRRGPRRPGRGRRRRRGARRRRAGRRARRRGRRGGGGRRRGAGGRSSSTAARATARTASSRCSGPARVSTERWWSGSRCTSRTASPPAAAMAAMTTPSRPSLTLTTQAEHGRGRAPDGAVPGRHRRQLRLACRLEMRGGGAGCGDARARRCRPTRRGPPGCRGRTRGTGPSPGTRRRSSGRPARRCRRSGRTRRDPSPCTCPRAIQSLSMVPPMPGHTTSDTFLSCDGAFAPREIGRFPWSAGSGPEPPADAPGLVTGPWGRHGR